MNVITTATKITILRIFLIVPTMIVFVAGMLLGAASPAYLPLIIITCILFVVLCATDFIDGNLARKTNTVSDLGKFLDPLADKVVVVIMLFLVLYFNKGLDIFPYNGVVIALMSGLIISRELAISVFRSVAAKKNIVMAADVYGKIKTVFLNIAIALLIIASLNPVLAWLGTITYYIGFIFAMYSGYNYVNKNKQVFAPVDEKKSEEKSAETNAEKCDCKKTEKCDCVKAEMSDIKKTEKCDCNNTEKSHNNKTEKCDCEKLDKKFDK